MGKINKTHTFQQDSRRFQKPIHKPEKKKRIIDHYEEQASAPKGHSKNKPSDFELLKKGLEKEKSLFETLRGNAKKLAARRIKALQSRVASTENAEKKKDRLSVVLNLMMLTSNILGKIQKIQRGVLGVEKARVAKKAKTEVESEVNPQVDPKHNETCIYQAKEKWELFSQRGPHMNDIRQGATGDCYFLAGLAAVTNKTADFVHEMIVDNHNGTLSVRFFQPNGRGQYEPVWVEIDGELPYRSNGVECYGKSQDFDKNGIPEIWVPLVEKAFAELITQHPRFLSTSRGPGYRGIGSGGYSDEAFRLITGKEAWRYSISRMEETELLEALSKANKGDYLAVGSAANAPAHIPGHHAYSVQRVFEENGVTYVELRNPWGKMGTESGYQSEGVFNLAFAEFKQFFASLYWAPNI